MLRGNGELETDPIRMTMPRGWIVIIWNGEAQIA